VLLEAPAIARVPLIAIQQTEEASIP